MSGPIPEVKKYALINDYENIIAYSEESEQSEVWANKCGFFKIHLGGLKVSASSGKFGYFYSHLILDTVFPAFRMTQYCYVSEYKHILFLKTGNLILNWVPLSFFYKHPLPKRLSSQSILPNSLVNWE